MYVRIFAKKWIASFLVGINDTEILTFRAIFRFSTHRMIQKEDRTIHQGGRRLIIRTQIQDGISCIDCSCHRSNFLSTSTGDYIHQSVQQNKSRNCNHFTAIKTA